jgi:hypothetical protein
VLKYGLRQNMGALGSGLELTIHRSKWLISKVRPQVHTRTEGDVIVNLKDNMTIVTW